MKNLTIESKNGYIEFIEYLKGVSIITIVLMHFLQGYVVPENSLIYRSLSFGGTGVHVFFFCSGFGLYYSWLKKKVSYASFLKKRFLKVYFPYIFVIITMFFIPYMYNGENRIIALLSHIFLFKMFVPRFIGSFGTQFWYVSTIFQFYFLFIPICFIKDKLEKKFLPISIVISMTWSFIVILLRKQEVRVWNSFFLQYLWEFAFGMLIAELIFSKKSFQISRKHIFVIAFVGLFIEGLMGFVGGTFKMINDIPALLGYMSLAGLIYILECNVINSFILKISKISYELYLLHMFVIETVFHFFGFKMGIHNMFLSFLSCVLSVLFANLFNKFISKYVYS